jgi:hypothetical protein
VDQAVPIILWLWIPASLLLFWLLRPSTAVLIALLGGYAILPIADFAAMSPEHRTPSWVMGMALPGVTFLSKATASALAALVGVVFFDLRRLLSFRPRWHDLPVLLWCLLPLLPRIGGHIPLVLALRDTAYLLLAWGVPYLLGRLCFSDLDGTRSLAFAIVIAGLVFLPVCLYEVPLGPTLYAHLYGYHPFQTEGAERYIGYRPLALLEDGNQLGMWMADTALVAIWLCLAKALPSMRRVPSWVIAAALLAMTLACQSVGAILLLFAGIGTLLLMPRINIRIFAICLVVCLAVFLAIRATGAWSVQTFAKKTRLGQVVTRIVKSTGRGSVGWRLAMEERHLTTARKHLLAGTGHTDWWREDKNGRPWGLWLLAFGAYGVIGLVTLHLIFLVPPFLLLRHIPPRCWRTPAFAAPAALAMLLLISMVDNLLNSTFILPLLLAAGAIGDLKFSPPSVEPQELPACPAP